MYRSYNNKHTVPTRVFKGTTARAGLAQRQVGESKAGLRRTDSDVCYRLDFEALLRHCVSMRDFLKATPYGKLKEEQGVVMEPLQQETCSRRISSSGGDDDTHDDIMLAVADDGRWSAAADNGWQTQAVHCRRDTHCALAFWTCAAAAICLVATAPVYMVPVLILLLGGLHIGLLHLLLRTGLYRQELVTPRRMAVAGVVILVVLCVVVWWTWNWRYTLWRLGKATLLKYMIKHQWVKLNTDHAASAIVQLHDIFTANNITYWLSEGTALGVTRERRILPWDDDVDVGIWDSERARMEKLLPVLGKHGFHLSDEQGSYFWKFLYKEDTIIDLDMTGPGHYCHAASSPCEDILKLVDNRTDIALFERQLSVPTEEYLVRLYTSDWHIPKNHYKPPCLGFSSNC